MKTYRTCIPTSTFPKVLKQTNRDRCILGIDPGLASTGYGIVISRKGRLVHVAHGHIETSAALSHPGRLLAIHTEITAIIKKYQPDEAGMETLFFSRNVSSAMGVAEARGVITLAIASAGIPLGEYTPNCIKQAVVGVTRADKRQVQESVRLLLGLTEIPRPDHAADALAAAITRIHTAEIPCGI